MEVKVMNKSTRTTLSTKAHLRAVKKLNNKKCLSENERKNKRYHAECAKTQKKLNRKLTSFEKNAIYKKA